MSLDCVVILRRLKSMARPSDLEGMARFGIPATNCLGVRVPEIRKLARQIGTDSCLAEELWKMGYRETRLLASMIEDADRLPEAKVEERLHDFDSWESTDQTILNCFWKHSLAYAKALEWSERESEFEKRAGFVLMAILAVKDKELENSRFIPFFEAIAREAGDDRNFVKKAVNWALRQIGKRNASLNRLAVELAEELKRRESRSARWIASDALRELKSSAVQTRLGPSGEMKGP